MGKTLDKIQYEMEKLGLVFNPDDGYVLKTPAGVKQALADGKVKVGSFEAHLGEKMVILADKEPKKLKKGMFK